jgi:hypothetical protein
MEDGEAAARQGRQIGLWELSSILQWAAADSGLVGYKKEAGATTAVAMSLHWWRQDWVVDSATRVREWRTGGGRAADNTTRGGGG